MSRPPDVDGLAIQIVYRPHDAVSGDFIDTSFEGGKLLDFASGLAGKCVKQSHWIILRLR